MGSPLREEPFPYDHETGGTISGRAARRLSGQFVYDVRADRKGFSLHVVRVRFLGIPLPRLLQPTLAARASEWRGRYRFSTVVGFWFCGRVISYFGYLDAPQ